MKILVVGSGFTGSTLARLLFDEGHDVKIIDRLHHIGGLCYSATSPNGITYEPYGARTFHTKKKEIKDFVLRFSKFNSYVHRKGMIIDGKLYHFPISYETIKKMPQRAQILKELEARPEELDRTNFETSMIDLFGPTLYKMFIHNYTKNMWKKEPKELTAEWAPKRLEIRKGNNELFEGQWQGLPQGGYTQLFQEINKGIPLQINTSYTPSMNKDYDLILFSGRIDESLKYKFGKLPYMSLHTTYKVDEDWEHPRYGTVNLPQHPKYIRKANFKILHQIETDRSWIQYQEPVKATNKNIPMYPINTKRANTLFQKYLQEAVKSDKIIPVGRLGLFKYLDMDKAIGLAIDMVPIIKTWKRRKPEGRKQAILDTLSNY